MNAPTRLELPEDWQPFDEVYRAFAEANPMLGLHTSEHATTRLRQQYGPRLLASGAVVRLQNRRWLASRQRFGEALFRAMSARRDEIVGGGPEREPDDGGAGALP
jgi:hypothetical protein